MKTLCLIFIALIRHTYSNNLLIIGDSYGFLSLDYLEHYCQDSVVYNHAVIGATATEWIDGVPDDVDAEIFDTDFDHVWFSIGANGACNSTREGKSEEVAGALATVVDQVGPSTSIVMTGYCSLTSCNTECDGDFDPFEARDVVIKGIEIACNDNPSCTFVDVWESCDYVPETGYSAGAYHLDPIHLKKVGYCKLFEIPELRSAFSCVGDARMCGNGNSLAYCPDGAYYCDGYFCIPNICVTDSLCGPRFWVIPLYLILVLQLLPVVLDESAKSNMNSNEIHSF